jgi:two-component system, OmpR family, response regulator
VWRGGIAIALTAREFSLLHVLMDRSGEVVTRTDLLEQVWDAHYDGLSNVVDVHVANVRRKLEIDGLPSVIDTVRGVGYKMQP